MRQFIDICEAESEVRRDVYKGTQITSSRVQQSTNLELKGRERIGYSYAILDTQRYSLIPEIVKFGRKRGFKVFEDKGIMEWLNEEIIHRTNPEAFKRTEMFTEDLHPALKKTFEGNSPAYTYTERLHGAIDYLSHELDLHPDSRRAYWPIYEQRDARRMYLPTRIPCSLGYQAMIRQVGSTQKLMLFYLQRSCDFDTFWLSDVWLAMRFQEALYANLLAAHPKLELGQFIHVILSLHSFTVENEEIY